MSDTTRCYLAIGVVLAVVIALLRLMTVFGPQAVKP